MAKRQAKKRVDYCWVVEGRSGSRSTEDNDNWVVHVYVGANAKALAQQHAKQAEAADVKLQATYQRRNDKFFNNPDAIDDAPRKGRNPFDPGHRSDDTCTYTAWRYPLTFCLEDGIWLNSSTARPTGKP